MTARASDETCFLSREAGSRSGVGHHRSKRLCSLNHIRIVIRQSAAVQACIYAPGVNDAHCLAHSNMVYGEPIRYPMGQQLGWNLEPPALDRSKNALSPTYAARAFAAAQDVVPVTTPNQSF